SESCWCRQGGLRVARLGRTTTISCPYHTWPNSTRLPAWLHAVLCVLLIQPLLQWSKVVKDGARVHLPLSGKCIESVRPWLALAHFQHLLQALACHLVVVNGAAVQGPL